MGNKEKKTKKNLFLIVPFSFEGEYKEVITNIENENKWDSKQFSLERFYDHVADLLSRQSEGHGIGRCFKLNQSVRKSLKLPNKTNQLVKLLKKDKEIASFSIPEINLFLFKTNVGILSYYLEFNIEENVDDFINGAYYVKSFNRKNVVFTAGLSQNEHEEVEVQFGELTNEILKDIDVETYFGSSINRNKKSSDKDVSPPKKEDKKHATPQTAPRPFHALVYSYLVLDEKPSNDNIDDIVKYVFYLRRSFRSSYKQAALEYDFTNNPELYQPFNNIYWGTSMEGLTCVAHYENDDETNDFLSSYDGHLNNAFYYLYILTLHQRYALLGLAKEASHLAAGLEDHSLVNGNDSTTPQKQISKLRKKISLFYLTSIFSQVSNITHQNRLYETIRHTLGIEELLEELKMETDSLAALAEAEELKEKEIIREREEKRREEELKEKEKIREQEEKRRETEQIRRNKLSTLIAIVSILFVLVNTFQSVWSMFVYTMEGRFPPHSEYACWFWGIQGFLIAIIMGVLLFYLLTYIVHRKNTNS